jgi:hypothetical protein
MAAFLDDLSVHLVNEGVVSAAKDVLKSTKSAIPAGDGPFLSIIQTPGIAPTRIQNQTAAATRRPTAQVVARAATYPAARAKAEAAFAALDGRFNVTINGTRYLSITARQEPGDLGLDEQNRPKVGFNIDAERA